MTDEEKIREVIQTYFDGMYESSAENRFFWASDYPHPDHTRDYIDRLKGLVAPLAPESRAKVLGENVDKVYQLS